MTSGPKATAIYRGPCGHLCGLVKWVGATIGATMVKPSDRSAWPKGDCDISLNGLLWRRRTAKGTLFADHQACYVSTAAFCGTSVLTPLLFATGSHAMRARPGSLSPCYIRPRMRRMRGWSGAVSQWQSKWSVVRNVQLQCPFRLRTGNYLLGILLKRVKIAVACLHFMP